MLPAAVSREETPVRGGALLLVPVIFTWIECLTFDFARVKMLTGALRWSTASDRYWDRIWLFSFNV